MDARSDPHAVNVPDDPGVYEVIIDGKEERLTIGKAASLRMRVKQGMVKGNAPHSSGERIRRSEDTSIIKIRWAKTDRPVAAEEELHRLHSRFLKRPDMNQSNSI